MDIPSKNEFFKGCIEYEKHEKRDSMYKVSRFYVSHFGDDTQKIADGLSVLLLTWNGAFYRFGEFDFEKLEKCLDENMDIINSFKNRNIFSFSESDEKTVINLFEKFRDALQRASGKKQGIKSPVSVAKALHLLAPEFFPIWDEKIAKNYKCYYGNNPADKYIQFCKITKEFAEKVKDYKRDSEKTLLKLIDEYNYSKYTKKWI